MATYPGLSSTHRTYLTAAHSLLRDSMDAHPIVAGLARQVDEILHPNAEERTLAKLEEKVVELRKADPTMTATEAKERVRRENPQLEAELAAAMHGRPVAA